MHLPNGLRALNHRDYRLFFVGMLISLCGTWMQSVGQSWLIVRLTDSAFLLGLIATLQFLPTLLFALVGGALADRLPKRKALLFTQGMMMLLAFVLAALVLTGTVQYWHVAVLATLLGLTNTLDVPLRQAFTVEMVGGSKQDLANAVALNSAIFNGARLVGPAAAGLMIAKWGEGIAFLLNGISFVAVLVSLALMTAQGLPKPRPKRSLLADVAEGLRYTWDNPVIFFLIAMLLAVGLFVINYSVLVPILANNVLNIGAAGYGYLMSALGAGALVGALILAFRSRSGPNLKPLITAGLVLCAAAAAMYFAHSFWVAMIILFVMGWSQILYTADTNTTIQILSPDDMRGRLMSLYQLVFAGSTPFGSLITGAVIERSNGSTGFLVDGALGLFFALLLLLWWVRRGGRVRALA
ncbi:MAG TPA: MFS transporter [Symbiobacteriaceae bacterium]|nr:MFS transporter [Symbiobacteriaceae bacterium]